MIPIYIGFDRKESIAYHVLAHSILSRASVPVEIIPLYRPAIAPHYWRPRGEFDSTDFSNSRWIVPHMQDYKGWAIFCDADMLCLADIKDLWEQRDSKYAVMVKKRNHVPQENVKFLGNIQTQYSRKNWSSLMLFNCAECTPLSRHIVNTQTPGLWFHQFRWIPDSAIGDINGDWNLLVGYDAPVDNPKLVHFTSGGPWFSQYAEVDYADAWFDELTDMMNGDSPDKLWRRDERRRAI